MHCTEFIIRSGRGRRAAHDATCAGGKGAHLLQLVAQRVSVPPFLIVTTHAFDSATRPVQKRVDQRLAQLEGHDTKTIEAAATEVQQWIRGCRLPTHIWEHIGTRIDEHLRSVPTFAVRSSVVGEDSEEHSFAGQMDSFLNVPRDVVMRTIVDVWASAYAPRALGYRIHKGLPLTNISTAVIIQAMVPAACAGVLFTRDPETREPVCVLSAGYGLGEGIVADRVETDTYRVDHAGRELSRVVRTKTARVVAAHSGGTRTTGLDRAQRDGPVLQPRQIKRLARMGARLERVFGSPQDVEWALDGRGRLSILQTRPIVYATQTPGRSLKRLWDNSNIVESYPGLTSPLTFSFVRDCYEFSFRNAAYGFVLDKRDLRDDAHMFENMIGLLDGRVYYNLFHWYKMLSFLPGYTQHKKSWDQMIGIGETVPFPQTRISMLNQAYALVMVGFRLLTVGRTARRFFRHFDRGYPRFRDLDFSDYSACDALSTFRALRREFTAYWHLTLYNDFSAMKYYDWLRRLCTRWCRSGNVSLHNDLLCGEEGVESTRPVMALLALTAMVNAEPVYRRLFAHTDPSVIWSHLQLQPEHHALKSAFDQYLQAYGDRGTEELKLERPSFREQPEAVVALVKAYGQRGMTAEQVNCNESRVRRHSEQVIRTEIRNPLKRAVLSFVLRKARRAVAQRENMRFARSRLFGVVRRLFARLAQIFVDEGVLALRDDLYFLQMSELFAAVESASVTRDLQNLADMRRREYERFKQTEPVPRIVTTGLPQRTTFSRPATHPGGGRHEDGDARARVLQGTGCSTGCVEGSAWIVTDPTAADRDGTHVLVARSTDPGWVFLMIRSHGIIVEKGSVLSHTAIIGREFGIPTVVGVEGATRLIQDGSRVHLNGATGEVRCA